MTIRESQRRTLDLAAESAGWNWADVEALAQEMYGECVAGLTKGQADELRQAMADVDSMAKADEEKATRFEWDEIGEDGRAEHWVGVVDESGVWMHFGCCPVCGDVNACVCDRSATEATDAIPG